MFKTTKGSFVKTYQRILFYLPCQFTKAFLSDETDTTFLTCSVHTTEINANIIYALRDDFNTENYKVLYSQKHAALLLQNYSPLHAQNHKASYAQKYTALCEQNYTPLYAQNYAALYARSYAAFYSQNYTALYSQNYAALCAQNYAAFYSQNTAYIYITVFCDVIPCSMMTDTNVNYSHFHDIAELITSLLSHTRGPIVNKIATRCKFL
jgi:nitrogen regulatory protein PII-like uncharacterized protein